MCNCFILCIQGNILRSFGYYFLHDKHIVYSFVVYYVIQCKIVCRLLQ